MKTTEFPPPVPREEEKPLLPAPEERPPEEWAEKAQKAMEARTLGRRLRRGKRILFSSRHHLPR